MTRYSLTAAAREVLHLAGLWKLLTFRKLLYFPRVLSFREKLAYTGLFFAACLSGVAGMTGAFFLLTVSLPATGGSYEEGLLGDLRTTNPLFLLQDAERDISRLVYAGLLSYDGTGHVVPDLAERYDISADGKTYTVFLRTAFWHDGTQVTADDILFTIKTIQNPAFKSVLRANWQGVNTEAIDARTIRFILRSPYAPFIENLTVGILPKHLWEGIGPERILLHELNLKPVGSGPYRFDQFLQSKDGSLLWYRLVRNSRYHREGPYLSRVNFSFFKTEEDLLHALRKETIDGFGPVSARFLSELNPQKIRVRALSMPRIFGLFFNQKKNSILAEKEVRAAIAHALDKEKLAKEAEASGAEPAASPLPFFPSGVEPLYPYDPEKSRALLEKMGWKDTNGDGIREKTIKEKKKEVSIPLRLTLATSDWPDLIRTAEYIKEKLRDVGIEVAVEKRPFPDLELNVIRPRNFDILLFGELYGFEEDPSAFWHSSQAKDPGLNITRYINPKADKLLEEARRTQDEATRKKLYQEFSTLLLEDLPAVFLYTQLYHYLLPADMQGVTLEKISLPADRFNGINRWYRKTHRVLKWVRSN